MSRFMLPLDRYTDRDLQLMMREAIRNMNGPKSLNREALRDLYAEYVQRKPDARDEK